MNIRPVLLAMLPVVRPNLTGSLNLNCLGLGCSPSPSPPSLNTSLASSNSEARAAVTSSEVNTRPLFILEMFRFTQLSC